MPTMFRLNGFRFFFFSNEHTPKHIHIEKADSYARIEIESLKVADSYNLTTKELKKLLQIVEKNSTILKEGWNEYFKE